MVRLVTHSPAETEALGRWLGQRLTAGDFVALEGNLGAGKSRLSAGLLTGLGIRQIGGSPTFTLLWEYEGRVPVYHWDVYRLGSSDELDDLGYEEYFYGDGVNLVEWADRVRELWPKKHLHIRLSYAEADDDRVLEISGSPEYDPLLEELTHADFGA